MFDHSNPSGSLRDPLPDRRDTFERSSDMPSSAAGGPGPSHAKKGQPRSAAVLLSSSLNEHLAKSFDSRPSAQQGGVAAAAAAEHAAGPGQGLDRHGVAARVEPAFAAPPRGAGPSASSPDGAPSSSNPHTAVRPDLPPAPSSVARDAADVRFHAADLVRYLVAVNATTYAALQDSCPDALLAIAQFAIDICTPPGGTVGAALRRMLEQGVLCVDAMGCPVLQPATMLPSGRAAHACLSASIADCCAQWPQESSQGRRACHAHGSADCCGRGGRGAARRCALQVHGLAAVAPAP
jgi:hypothetical protein